MEPYRPFVDETVYEMYHGGQNCDELGKQEKATLLGLITKDVIINEQTSPLTVALNKTTASLAQCFEGKTEKNSIIQHSNHES